MLLTSCHPKQTIALDNLASLAKQARTLHRERQRLRTEVLRLRREREQVTLRLDAVRARHARVSSRARTTLDLSRRMHDVEAVVERGGTVNTATAAEARRAAELPNLEISAARVAAMVGTGTSTTTQGGRGWLGEVKAFNAFLERAARALEARAWMVDRGLSKTNRDET